MIIFCLAFYQVDFLSCKQLCTLNDLGGEKARFERVLGSIRN